jgi:hypothetical protein
VRGGHTPRAKFDASNWRTCNELQAHHFERQRFIISFSRWQLAGAATGRGARKVSEKLGCSQPPPHSRLTVRAQAHPEPPWRWMTSKTAGTGRTSEIC